MKLFSLVLYSSVVAAREDFMKMELQKSHRNSELHQMKSNQDSMMSAFQNKNLVTLMSMEKLQRQDTTFVTHANYQ